MICINILVLKPLFTFIWIASANTFVRLTILLNQKYFDSYYPSFVMLLFIHKIIFVENLKPSFKTLYSIVALLICKFTKKHKPIRIRWIIFCYINAFSWIDLKNILLHYYLVDFLNSGVNIKFMHWWISYKSFPFWEQKYFYFCCSLSNLYTGKITL